MNGFGLSGEDTQDPQRIDAFAKGFSTFLERIKRLDRRRSDLVSDLITSIGDRRTVPFNEYRIAAMRHAPGPAEAFSRVCAHFGTEP